MTDQATKPRSAIALCCLNSAALLDLADQGIHEPKELERLRVHNHGQAQFLRVAADLADEMLAALKNVTDRFERCMLAHKNSPQVAAENVAQARAAIAKAEGRAP